MSVDERWLDLHIFCWSWKLKANEAMIGTAKGEIEVGSVKNSIKHLDC